MSWKPEVKTFGGDEWAGNTARFATEIEAQHYVSDLSYRWTSVRATRVIEVDEPVNYRWTADGAKRIEEVN
jgi:hypothetical protein